LIDKEGQIYLVIYNSLNCIFHQELLNEYQPETKLNGGSAMRTFSQKNDNSPLILDVFFNLKAYFMSQKKIDILGQTKETQDQPNVNKGSIVQYLKSLRISSKNTTHEKLGQTTLIFTNGSKQLVKDDSLEASIRYLRFRSFIR
jgi:hypothetical protein